MGKIEPLVIITDGLSGMTAAKEAAELGLPSIILDPSAFPSYISDYVADRPELIHLVRVASQVQVIGIFESREILWSQDDSSGTFRADQILLETGAFTRHMPFPGCELPGVISHDELAFRLRNGDVLNGKRAIVAGGGDGLAYSAQGLIDSGVEVVAILDLGLGPRRSEQFSFMRFEDFGVVDLSETPLITHHAIFEVHGKDRVTSVTFGPIDPQTWQPCEGPTRTEAVDLVVTGLGCNPRNELSVIAGCKQKFNADNWCWEPIRDSLTRTSVPGIFALRRSDGKAGHQIEYFESQIAAITAGEQAGVLTAEEATTRRARPFEWLAKLNVKSRIQPGLLDLLKPDTVVCRCENVTLANVNQAINQGACDLTSLKMKTRLGMGMCQGRDCAFSASMIVCRATGRTPEEVGTINPRPPAMPVTLGALAKMENRLPTLDGEAS